jgi:hypothetical protein
MRNFIKQWFDIFISSGVYLYFIVVLIFGIWNWDVTPRLQFSIIALGVILAMVTFRAIAFEE